MNIKKKKICFIAGTLGQGGAERQLFYYLKTLSSMNVSLYLLTFTKDEFWEEKIKKLGIQVIWVGRRKSKIGRLISIIKEIKKRPIDIIQSQHFHTNLYVSITARLFGISEIGALRSDVYREIKELGKIGKLCFSLPRLIATNSNSAIKNALFLGKKDTQLFYFPNFVDENHFFPLDINHSGDQMVVTYVGTLWKPKRVDRVILLAKFCREEKLNIKFYIYGDGVLLDDLKTQAKNFGVLNENLFFQGRNPDILSIYQYSDVLLLTSDHEGTPNVVLEAMACGLPVISSNIGDVPELIKNGVNGFLFEPNDLSSAFISIKLLYKNPELRKTIGLNNRNFILRYRSLSNMPDYFNKLYGILGQ